MQQIQLLGGGKEGSGMNILVTGGAGFIGSHLAKRLLKEGHRVLIIDNESTGKRENVPRAAQYVIGDVTKNIDLEQIFSTDLDAVFHIAGQVSLINSFHDPVRDMRTNIEGTVNVLQHCIKYQVPRFLYASSMTVYGESKPPLHEDLPGKPISNYGITKYAAERYVHTMANREDIEFDFHVTTFRMFNVYGPVQALNNPYQGVLGIFIGNVLRNEPITIFGDGEQTRDFVYIDDIIDAWMLALDNPNAKGEIFNLGSGKEISIKGLAASILSECNKIDHPINHGDTRPGEQRRVWADIHKAQEKLCWKPGIEFSDGLSATIEWATENSSVETFSSS